MRWLKIIVTFDTTITLSRRKSNTVPEALSRQSSQIEENTLNNTKVLMKANQKTKQAEPLETDAIAYVIENTENYETLKTKHKTDDEFRGLIHATNKPCMVSNNLIYYKNSLCIPEGKLKQKLLYFLH